MKLYHAIAYTNDYSDGTPKRIVNEEYYHSEHEAFENATKDLNNGWKYIEIEEIDDDNNIIRTIKIMQEKGN